MAPNDNRRRHGDGPRNPIFRFTKTRMIPDDAPEENYEELVQQALKEEEENGGPLLDWDTAESRGEGLPRTDPNRPRRDE
jgi:hypothetical protein